jgi:hypothetical protein
MAPMGIARAFGIGCWTAVATLCWTTSWLNIC